MIDFRQLFEHSPNPYVLLDREFRFVEMNPAYLRVTGRSRDELLGIGLFDAFPGDPAADNDSSVGELRASLERVVDSGRPDVLGLIRYSIPVRTGAGIRFEERYWSATHTPLVDADGRTRFILQNTMDVTELQRLKAELRQAQGQELPLEQLHGGILARAQGVQEANRVLDSQRRHLLQLFDEAPGFMAYLSGPEHRFELVNPAYTRLVGGRRVTGMTVKEALPDIQGQGFVDLLDQVYTRGEPFVGRGMQVHLTGAGASGPETRHVDFVYQPVRDGHGGVVGILVQGHDITAQAIAQAELRRHHDQLEDLVRERTRALAQSEQALLHAQKLEAVGKLTGGVAHDFNNVLQVIGANLQLIQRHPGADEAVQSRAGSAMEAVARGARLSSQLLAFARQQPLRPVVFNLGERLHALDELLQRTLGENIEVRLHVEPGVANVEADVHQLENAVLNLALNARDAMPHGGRLALSVRNVEVTAATRRRGTPEELEPGHYVALEVVDDGHGMQPAVSQRAFEPFFTTKSEGRGTGLGLSMVYGFVKQSGGHIHIDSEPRRGTVVTIWLPRVDAPSTLAAAPVAPVAGQDGRGEVVLVVEDEDAVRRSTVETVRALGYEVVEARDGAEALALLRNGPRVDLLFTDVIMPGPVQSPELARQARELQPDIAVLFTSGYTRDVVFHDGRLDEGVELLQKPYLREDLAVRLRRLLDRERSGARLRILLVEDDADHRRLLADLLDMAGHRVTAVADAAAAVAAATGPSGDGFDLLLSDVRLPDTPGPVLAESLRQRRPELAVLLMSGHSAAELREMGVTGPVLHKPFRPDALDDALRRAVAAPAATGDRTVQSPVG
jgi:signal transduction histidine kinase/CheY-like chemotaxis protein